MSVVRKACQKKGEVAKSLANSIEFFSDEKREKNSNKVGHYPVLSACWPYARAISPTIVLSVKLTSVELSYEFPSLHTFSVFT